jgi:hypothetical protein
VGRNPRPFESIKEAGGCRAARVQVCAAAQSMELLYNLSKVVFFDPATEKRID